MSRKVICLVIPSLQAGGMERVMSELAWHFSTRKEVELHLVLYGIKREIFYAIPDNVVIHKPAFRFRNSFRLLYALKTLGYLRKTISRIRPDTVLSFGEYWNSFVLLSIYGLKYPVFVSDRCQPNKSFGKFHNFLRKYLYPKAAGIIAQTDTAKEIYKKARLNKNIRVIGNPIRYIEAKGREIKKENIVLSVGRLINTKHHDKLIELFLKINNPGWKLVIVGYDHLKQDNMSRLKKLISQNHAENRVVLAGKSSNVDEFYLKSKLFAFTSSSEGFPNVIGEALSAALPVVAFDCIAGPSEMIVNDHNGYLIPLFDYQLFQEKLNELMTNDEKRAEFSSKSINSINKFSSDIVCESFYSFITDI